MKCGNDQSIASQPARCYGMPAAFLKVIAAAPLVIILGFSAALAIPQSRAATLELLRENQVVEVLTFVFLFAGAAYGMVVTGRLATGRVDSAPRWPAWFYGLFSVGLFLTAMEEIAWGQWILGFDQPEFLRDLNVKGETTIHNIRGLDARTESLRVAFGAAGLLGVWLHRFAMFRVISAPTVLSSWFVLILILAGVDLLNDFKPIGHRIDKLIFHLNEVVEMMIGMAALLYLVLNARALRIFRGREARPTRA